MKLYQVQSVSGTDYCSIEGKRNDYFLYEFCIGQTKSDLEFKTLNYDEFYFYYNDEEHTDYTYGNYRSGRDGWDLSDDNGIKLIGSIE